MKVYWNGEEEEEEEEEERTKCSCKVCNREFNSIKALYGHMRSHPNRTWKGIQPPISISSSISSSLSLSSSSLPLPFPSWSLTAKRGRKGISSVAVVAAVSSSSSASEVEPTSLFALIDAVSQQKEINVSSPPMKKMKKIELKKNDLDNSLISENGIHQLKEVKKLYKCNSCGKEFGSHQALGGHKSSHYKAKIQLLVSDLTRIPQERRILNFDLNELPPKDDDDDNDNGEAKQA